MDFPMYTLTDLGAPDLGMLSGSLRSEATAVNWHQTGALVTAYSTSASGTVPDGPLYPPDGSARASWLYDELDGQPANVVSLADTNYGQPLGLDSHYPSTIVGWVSSDGRTPLPAIWERDEPPLAPGASQTPGGVGQLRDINNIRIAAGWLYTRDNVQHAHVIVRSARPDPSGEGNPQYDEVDLLPGVGSSQWASDAYRINDNNLVVGWTTWPEGRTQACAWDIGANLERLGDPPIYIPMAELTNVGSTSIAFSVNSSGEIVGVVISGTFVWGFQRDIHGNRTSPDPGYPGNPPKYNFTCYSPLIPFDINDEGVIVGTCGVEYQPSVPVGRRHAFISVAGEEAVSADLNTLVTGQGAAWELVSATGINNRGDIVGSGHDPNGQLRAWLLSPV
jgi:hypothetical protein